MKKYILPLLMMMACFAACNNHPAGSSNYLNTSNLVAQSFTIATDKDTSLQTKDGIIITVPANSIQATTHTVTLQVKEALSMAEILKAGLTTKAGNDILSSDGMFYLGIQEQATITKALHIKLPTENADKRMQLYKGVETGGNIDWQSPTPIANTITPLADTGKILFKANCASCHGVTSPMVGGPLAWMDKQRSKDWLYAYIRNYFKLLASGDKYAKCIHCKYNGAAMPVFPNLSNQNIDAICRYVDKVAKQAGIPETFNPNSACDSCEYYHAYFYGLNSKRDSLVKNNGSMANIYYTPSTWPAATNNTTTSQPYNETRSFVQKPQINAEYYEFDITTTGWYNIDLLWKMQNGEQKSQLIVRVKGQYTERVKIYLAIPSVKIFTEGGFLENNKDYGFDEANGTIPLPQNTKAYIIAVSEQHERLYYTQQPFETSLSQTIDITLQEASKTGMLASFDSIGLSQASLTVKKTIHFDAIKGIDVELEKIKEKLKFCACSEPNTAPADTSVIERAVR